MYLIDITSINLKFIKVGSVLHSFGFRVTVSPKCDCKVVSDLITGYIQLNLYQVALYQAVTLSKEFSCQSPEIFTPYLVSFFTSIV